MEERGLSCVKLIISNEHKRKVTESKQRIFYWIKLTDVLCTSDKQVPRKVPKKEKEMVEKFKKHLWML